MNGEPKTRIASLIRIVHIPVGPPFIITTESVDGQGNLGDVLSSAVGGYFEAVALRAPEALAGYTLYVNEEGLLQRLKYNGWATIAARLGEGTTSAIVGNAVIAGPLDAGGDHLTVTDEALAVLEDWLGPAVDKPKP